VSGGFVEADQGVVKQVCSAIMSLSLVVLGSVG
jgi:hypothetical protein